jgi:IS5 family transposase
MTGQTGFFDLADRYKQLSKYGDALERLTSVVDWKIFMPLINRAFDKMRKSPAGRKPYNRLMMFKVLVLQSLYNLADGQTEYQIKDRLSFMRFLGLSLESDIPDEKTIWLYREILTQTNTLEKLFKRFDDYLSERGICAEVGHIVDATIVEVPRQRNSRDDNKEIKEGKIPKSFMEKPNQLRQKDIDARWTMKGGETYYGYKNHVNIDVKNKMIRSYTVTAANSADIGQLEPLLEAVPKNDKKVWADSAYYSAEQENRLKEKGYESRIINKTAKNLPAGSAIVRENSRRAKIRKRVEHVFGFMQNSMKGKFFRAIGLIRAKTKLGLKNLVHNICRYEQICRIGTC